MRTRSRRVAWVGLWLLVLACFGPIGDAVAGENAGLAYFRQAKINWRQFEGQKLTIGLNKHS